jgi:AcrB/AcrD/AcrF family
MILLFLGSWRSTLIIVISIPLSVLFSVVCTSALGETTNVMTLGGLELAVGMLVDEGTVTLENIFYHLEMGKKVEPAILDGAQQIVVPAFRHAARSLHRVRTDVPARRRRRSPVQAVGRGGRIRPDRVVRTLPHAGADHGALSPACAYRNRRSLRRIVAAQSVQVPANRF